MLEDPDTDNPALSVERIDNILHGAWDVVIKKYADKREPHAKTFMEGR